MYDRVGQDRVGRDRVEHGKLVLLSLCILYAELLLLEAVAWRRARKQERRGEGTKDVRPKIERSSELHSRQSDSHIRDKTRQQSLASEGGARGDKGT